MRTTNSRIFSRTLGDLLGLGGKTPSLIVAEPLGPAFAPQARDLLLTGPLIPDRRAPLILF